MSQALDELQNVSVATQRHPGVSAVWGEEKSEKMEAECPIPTNSLELNEFQANEDQRRANVRKEDQKAGTLHLNVVPISDVVVRNVPVEREALKGENHLLVSNAGSGVIVATGNDEFSRGDRSFSRATVMEDSMNKDDGSDNEAHIILREKSQSELFQRKLENSSKHKLRDRKYSEVMKTLEYLHKFDWWESHLNRHMPIKFMTPTCFWFMICCNYLPRRIFIQKSPEKLYNDAFKALSELKVEVPIQIGKRITNRSDFEDEVQNALKDAYSQDFLLKEEIGNKLSEYLAETHVNGESSRHQKVELEKVVKNEYDQEDDEALIEMRSQLLSFGRDRLHVQEDDSSMLLRCMGNLPLDNIIDLYQRELNILGKDQKKRRKTLLETMKDDIQNESIFIDPDIIHDDVLDDLFHLTQTEREYLSHLETKQHEIRRTEPESESPRPGEASNAGLKVHRNSQPQQEDFACQICNEGDYTEDDLIVFCSRCNISVHQKCYGIMAIPQDDWICSLCQAFGPKGKYLRCPLCSKRSGALKPTHLPSTHAIWANFNPNYHRFMASGEFTKEDFECAGKESPTKDDLDNYKEKLHYDFHMLKDEEFTEKDLVDEPRPYHAWVHMTCAFWTPEIYFSDRGTNSRIEGIETIDHQRFKLTCNVCRLKRAGSCVQCYRGKCHLAFHPECARRAKLYMEIKREEKSPYLIYCDKHTPLKLRRNLEAKERKYREEIFKFCKSIEKYYETYGADQRIRVKSVVERKPIIQKSLTVKRRTNEETENREIISAIVKYFKSRPEYRFTITVERVSKDESGAPTYKIIDAPKPREFHLRSNISKNDEVWENIVYKNGSCKNYTPMQLYKRYKRYIEERQKAQKLKDLETRRSKRALPRKNYSTVVPQVVPTDIVEEGLGAIEVESPPQKVSERVQSFSVEPVEEKKELYCICRTEDGSGDMIECDMCKEWYHLKCIGLKISIEEASAIPFFVCPMCQDRNQSREVSLLTKRPWMEGELPKQVLTTTPRKRRIDFDTEDINYSSKLRSHKKD